MVGRLLLCVALGAGAARADEPSRLGTLLRWYLAEQKPARQYDLIDKIRRLARAGRLPGDTAQPGVLERRALERVVAALRAGAHLEPLPRPTLRAEEGPHPALGRTRHRIQDVSAVAGRYAALTLPADYRPARAWPLVVDVGPRPAPVPAGTVGLRIDLMRHPAAAGDALAAEALVLSIAAHVTGLVRVDPMRVFLRGRGRRFGALAWSIALQNPDRFAGVVAIQGAWRAAAPLAANGRLFSFLVVQKRNGDPGPVEFLAGLNAPLGGNIALRAPPDPTDDATLLPKMARWYAATRCIDAPAQLTLAAARDVATRAFWLSFVPRRQGGRSHRIGTVWETRLARRPATIDVRRDPDDRNLLRVKTSGVRSFQIHPDLTTFDLARPLRVSVNGSVPEAKLIRPSLARLLEDYRRRRNAGVAAVDTLMFSGR